MKRVVIVLVAMLLSWPILTQAEPCGPQTYTDQVKEPNYDCPSPLEDVLLPTLPELPSVELKKGDAAPRGGLLLDVNRVLLLGLRIKSLRHIRWIEITTTAKKMDAEIKYQQKVGETKEKLLQSQVDSYKGQLQTALQDLEKERKWYKSWTFGVVVGVAVTAAGATALGYALRK